MKARPVLAVVLIGACAFLAVWLWAANQGQLPEVPPGTRPRIVSLSPAITETLFALGAGDAVVGVTTRCDYPPEAGKLARVGAGISPDLEAIARLRPTLILGEATQRLSSETLAPLAPTELLPWLTADEIVRGVRALGVLVGRRGAAEDLAGRMEQRWRTPPAANAARVLMLLGDKPGRLGPIYFVKPGSLHDTLLTAAGARNAYEGTVRGAPILSLEGILQLDPDAIVILVADDVLAPGTREAFLADFATLPSLRAVRNHRVRVLNGGILFVTGPRVLAVIDQVAAALHEMGLGGAPGSQGPT